jgi:hypothetical protein
MVVTLNAVTLNNIIDFDSSQANNVTVPLWINQNPDIDKTVWNKTTERLTYTLRVTDAEYVLLRALQNSHALITYQDTIYGASGQVWIEKLDGDYSGDEDYYYPWVVRLILIKI